MRVLRFVSLFAVLCFVPTAAADAASRVFIVHGIPGVPVDVYATPAGAPIPATATVASFQPKQIVDVTAGPGSYDIRIYAAGVNPQSATPVIQVLGAAIPDNVELSIVAHLSGAGTPTATVYRNDNAPVAAGGTLDFILQAVR